MSRSNENDFLSPWDECLSRRTRKWSDMKTQWKLRFTCEDRAFRHWSVKDSKFHFFKLRFTYLIVPDVPIKTQHLFWCKNIFKFWKSMNKHRSWHLDISDLSDILFEVRKFKYRGLFFQEPTLGHFFEVSVLLFFTIFFIFMIARSSLLNDSTLKINEIWINIQPCNCLR